jgi:outer membrane usher protein FimD/PapC
LTNTAELYRNITAFLNGGLSSSTAETDQKIDAMTYSWGINLIPAETLNITLSSSYEKSDRSGGGVPASSQFSRAKEASVSYYPFRALYLYASRSERSGSDQPRDTLTNFGLNWSPFQGGDLQFNFAYSESRRALDNSIDKIVTPSLRWNITRWTYTVAAYNSTRNTSDFGQSTSRTYSVSLNMSL